MCLFTTHTLFIHARRDIVPGDPLDDGIILKPLERSMPEALGTCVCVCDVLAMRCVECVCVCVCACVCM
jgi:hypothetical protein